MFNKIRSSVFEAVCGSIFFLASFCLANAAESTSPYYVRVDFGGSISRDAAFKNNACDPLSAPLCYLGPKGLNKIGNSALISGGLGFKASNFFRIELSVDYKSGFKLNESYNGGNNYWGSNTKVSSSIATVGGFATGYVEVAPLLKTNFGIFEPYIGFGLGVSQNSMKSGYIEDKSDPTTILGAKFAGSDSTSLSYRLLIGSGVRITPNLALDIGYRYSDYGKLSISNQQSNWTVNNVPVQSTFSGFKGNLKSDDVTIGVRYNF